MTKYYVGYLQGNNEYVYVAGIDTTNVRVSTISENAIGFENKESATDLLNIVKLMVLNQDYKVLEIVKEIKEVK